MKAQIDAMTALGFELGKFAETDSRHRELREKILAIAEARMHEQQLTSTYAQRMLAHYRRVQRSDEAAWAFTRRTHLARSSISTPPLWLTTIRTKASAGATLFL